MQLNNFISENTICAISTAPGVGGIAVIRLSGPEAFTITDKLFVPMQTGITVSAMQPNTVRFGKIMRNDELIDEVLLAVFHAPHSFTGEHVVEISCHGSTYIQQQILRLLIDNGCQLAQPGEFTQRAFLNGKFDLSQAEAVADLIASNSAASHKLAMQQMRGGFSKELMLLRGQLLNFTSLIELELDFSEEEVEFADRKQLFDLAELIEQKISKLANSFQVGNAIKNGIPVAIVGETNVGKSTLLNHLLNEERAIVSDIHGTTRDVIEECITVQGIMFRFIDTAGIRHTTDTIENLGIERTYQKIEQASIVLWVIDSTTSTSETLKVAPSILEQSQDKQLIIIFNKIDKISESEKQQLQQEFAHIGENKLFISAKESIHTEQLEQALLKAAQLPELSGNDVVVTNLRHYEALSSAHESITRVINGLQHHIPGDLVAQDIRECLHHLGLITGQITTDEVLGNIFAHFCIGK